MSLGGKSIPGVDSTALYAAVNMLSRPTGSTPIHQDIVPQHTEVTRQYVESRPVAPPIPVRQDPIPAPVAPVSRTRNAIVSLFVIRTGLLVFVLYWLIGVHLANKHAISVWHTAVVKRQCEDADTTTALPSWLASRGQTDAILTIAILIASAMFMMTAEFILAASDAIGHRGNGMFTSRCVIFYYYRVRQTKALWAVATLTLLVALVVASIHTASLPIDGNWQMPECAEAAESAWLYTGNARFWWVPLALTCVLVMDLLAWVLSRRYSNQTKPTHDQV
jgi:hypothetical protein